MSDPAYIWIIENGQIKYHYFRWLGNHISQDLFWGEPFILRLAEINGPWVEASQEIFSFWERGIVNEGGIVVEGGILVDRDRKILLFWQSDMNRDYPIDYRLLVDLMKITWPGWKIYYAADEDFDIQRYIHWRRTGAILSGPEVDCVQYSIWESFPSNFPVSILETDGQIRHYQVKDNVTKFLCSGEKIIPAIREKGSPFQWMPYDHNHHYLDLLAIDLSHKMIWIYQAIGSGWRASQMHISSHWPGWQVNFHFGWIYQHCALVDMDWTQILQLPVNFLPDLAKSYSLDYEDDVFEGGIPVCIDSESRETRFLSPIKSNRLSLAGIILNNWRSRGGNPVASLGKACEWLVLDELLS